MGDIKKTKRHFDKPKKRWDKARIETEREVKKKMGLKNKRELWRTETFLKNKKKEARALLALDLEKRIKREKELIDSVAKYGLLSESATIDDMLSLSTESILERRLQTIAWRKGLAGTMKQARQFIVHGHIAINGKKTSIPGYLVKKSEEEKIDYYGTPMVVQEKKKKEIKKEPTEKDKLKKDFEEAKPEGAEAESAEETAKEEIENIEEKEATEENSEEAEEEAVEEEKDSE